MRRVFSQRESPYPDARPMVTIGMFDGVHRGHQAVLSATMAWARAQAAPALAITFDIHPRSILAPGQAPAMITSLEHRLTLLEALGVDGVCVLSFHAGLASTEAEAFVHEYLVDVLHVQGIVLGSETRFGRAGRGDAALLESLAAAGGFALRSVPPVVLEGLSVSSTAIRQAVQAGDLVGARRMLGRPPSVLGTVTRGRGLGRRLGFPTLNLDPHHELRPPQGVYVTRTRCGDTLWGSVTNVGHRPTVDAASAADVLVETHLLDYTGELYGQTVEVMFLERLREERRFDTLDAMVCAIRQDAGRARAHLARNPLQTD